MKYTIDNIILNPDQDESELHCIVSEKYSIKQDFTLSIIRKSLDSRRKNRIVFRYRLLIELSKPLASLQNQDGVSLYTEKTFPAIIKIRKKVRINICGSGPAGLFAALRLIEAGADVEIFEQGKPLEERINDIQNLENEGVLNPKSNILFGEGGAGTFSDGKLTSRINHPGIGWVFQQLVDAGAPESILYEAHPHLGTDRLRGIIKRIRDRILNAGSLFHFNEQITHIDTLQGKLRAFTTSVGNEYESEALILACGHSSRETYFMLGAQGIKLEKKGFAIGVRVEHPADLIREIQYGASSYKEKLPPAEYRLTFTNRQTGRGVYSFCMCPGGAVINSSSEDEGLCTNGMSTSSRDSIFSNAAIVITVKKEELDDNIFSGIKLQSDIEHKAYRAGGGHFAAPAQKITSFFKETVDNVLPDSSYKNGISSSLLQSYLPEWITEELKLGLQYFNRKMKGFISDEGVLIGAETRTSSPIRIVRGDNFESVSVKGLFPAGEGAGYSGGIISSAVDGMRAADAIIKKMI